MSTSANDLALAAKLNSQVFFINLLKKRKRKTFAFVSEAVVIWLESIRHTLILNMKR